MKPAKKRADQSLVDRGLVETRSKAQALIMAGKVFSGEKRIEKPGQPVPDESPLEVRGQEHPWVSRGGMKLDHGLDVFNLDVAGMTAIDVGSSTGGFTDVLLQRGAKKVYAVDVGRGQLHWKLRTDERVIVLESTNARTLTEKEIPEKADVIVCDASFIGLEKVLPAAMALTADRANLVALIKPQFQLSRDAVGKGGVVRDPALHEEACRFVEQWINSLDDWTVEGITESPITGPEGNREFLIHASKRVN